MALLTNIAVLLDKNEDGSFRKTKNGYYRFSLAFKDAAGNFYATVRGFRAISPFMRFQYPISSWKDSTFTFIELRRDAEDAILADVKSQVESYLNSHEGAN